MSYYVPDGTFSLFVIGFLPTFCPYGTLFFNLIMFFFVPSGQDVGRNMLHSGTGVP